MSFGETLKALRTKAKLTQQGAANVLGLSVGTYRNYEYGRYTTRGTNPTVQDAFIASFKAHIAKGKGGRRTAGKRGPSERAA